MIVGTKHYQRKTRKGFLRLDCLKDQIYSRKMEYCLGNLVLQKRYKTEKKNEKGNKGLMLHRKKKKKKKMYW